MALTKIPSELSSTTGIVDNSNATAITIDSNENVGIGTTSPSDTLSVNGQIGFFGNDGQLKFNDGSAIKGGNNYGDIRIQTDRFRVYNEAGSNLAMNIDSSGNVGIGTSSPDTKLHVEGNILCDAFNNGGAGNGIFFRDGLLNTAQPSITLADHSGAHPDGLSINAYDGISFRTADSERMRIDASGNLLVGTTSTDPAASSTETGVTLKGGGFVSISRNDSAASVNINKIGYDGSLVDFRKNGSTVGSIGTSGGDLTIGTGDTGLAFLDNQDFISPWNITTNSGRDNAVDIGHGFIRFQDIYATNGTIQTSDRNEKQDIAELSDAEQRAAVACKGLLRKFRWKDAVSKKGDDARIHFGIIAQDLQAAFEAEGLDASRYAMWCSDTWWEQDVEVPAVEAVDAVYETQTDEEGNETQVLVQEAVEAVDAYTRTDTFETAEEAPEGATEKTRLGVRYSELLAFIISAI